MKMFFIITVIFFSFFTFAAENTKDSTLLYLRNNQNNESVYLETSPNIGNTIEYSFLSERP